MEKEKFVSSLACMHSFKRVDGSQQKRTRPGPQWQNRDKRTFAENKGAKEGRNAGKPPEDNRDP